MILKWGGNQLRTQGTSEKDEVLGQMDFNVGAGLMFAATDFNFKIDARTNFMSHHRVIASIDGSFWFARFMLDHADEADLFVTSAGLSYPF